MIVEFILISVSGIDRGTPVDNSIMTTVGPLVGASIESELIGNRVGLTVGSCVAVMTQEDKTRQSDAVMQLFNVLLQ